VASDEKRWSGQVGQSGGIRLRGKSRDWVRTAFGKPTTTENLAVTVGPDGRVVSAEVVQF
jgi:hypothetical protein